MSRKEVTIHSDGGCHGNPGPGGWAAVLSYGDRRRELSGGVLATTNNRMELQGAIEALGALKEPCRVVFHTDSAYVRKGVTQWVRSWKRNGWMTQTKQAVKNADLWRALDELCARHEVTWHWVKGHAGDEGNERCDQLATEAIVRIKQTHTAERLKNALAEFVRAQAPEVAAELAL